eukprot:6100783-Pyramimonas_sp.AAC.1
MPPRGPKTAPRRFQMVTGPHSNAPSEARIIATPDANQRAVPPRLPSSRWILKPQDGSNISQESPTRDPSGPPKRPQQRPTGP